MIRFLFCLCTEASIFYFKCSSQHQCLEFQVLKSAPMSGISSAQVSTNVWNFKCSSQHQCLEFQVLKSAPMSGISNAHVRIDINK
ncbi:hypothetical protein DPMN_005643 [Dreissena polymorpha]|uniref:Uncharacterized protein n=1 Tax=Dreissena polymorpha TaxID=45954 RepID=A0A9D4RU34_DREPO|nr:hypothetical protein DPMN_005643 [Dreissena polymorpha]